MPKAAETAIQPYLHRSLLSLDGGPKTLTGYSHRRKAQRLEALGLARVLSTGVSDTIAVLTPEGIKAKADLLESLPLKQKE